MWKTETFAKAHTLTRVELENLGCSLKPCSLRNSWPSKGQAASMKLQKCCKVISDVKNYMNFTFPLSFISYCMI
jgi:hypothetical protein